MHGFYNNRRQNNLFIDLLRLLDDITLCIILEAPGGNFIQSQDLLVRILDQDELAFFTLETHVSDGADDAPSVGQAQVHLLSEVAGLPAYDAENNVLVIGLGVCTGDESVYDQ